jgi:hypothetical protein
MGTVSLTFSNKSIWFLLSKEKTSRCSEGLVECFKGSPVFSL